MVVAGLSRGARPVAPRCPRGRAQEETAAGAHGGTAPRVTDGGADHRTHGRADARADGGCGDPNVELKRGDSARR